MSGVPTPSDWFAGLLAGRSVPAAVDAPATERMDPAPLAEVLRQRLALRGRTQPTALLPPGIVPQVRRSVLEAVLPDVDAGRGGEGWLLRDAPRRQVLAGLGPRQMQALQDDPAPNDGTWQALTLLQQGSTAELGSLTADQLGNLARTLDMVGPLAAWDAEQAGDLRRRLKRRLRRADYACLAGRFVGRRWDQWHLRAFLARPLDDAARRDSASVQAMVIGGMGGTGKSALLSAVLGPMLDREPDLPLVHLDFDRPALDPLVPSSLDLELLRQIGLVSHKADAEMAAVRVLLRANLADYGSGRRGLSLESASSGGVSAMEGSLSWLSDVRRPLLLVLDTAERVQAGGPARVGALLDWIGRLAAGSGAPELRVVLAGRDDPDVWVKSQQGGRRELAGGGTGPQDRARVRRLPDLKAEDAEAMLRLNGVKADDAPALARRFGGNPLVLRLVADLAVRGDRLGQADGKLPDGLVQGYLHDRILKHIGEPAASYAQSGLVLPSITQQMVAEVLGPAKGKGRLDPGLAADVFDGLASPAWLMRRSGDAIRLRPDLRRFTLQLIASDPAHAAELRAVHEVAARWHSGQDGAEHQAMALYHALMLDPFSMPDTLARDVAPYLIPLLDDLPPIAATALRTRMGQVVSETIAAGLLSDRDWISYLGDDSGAGELLTSARSPGEILQLWRNRPSGGPGTPPSFVLQALAEAADWGGNEADLDWIGKRLLRNVDNNEPARAGQRLYWATCLALLRPPHVLPRALASALRAALRNPNTASLWRPADLTRLAALAELLAPAMSTRLMPNLPGSLGVLGPRVAMALGQHGSGSRSLEGAAMVVLQRDWHVRLGGNEAGFYWPEGLPGLAQAVINALDGAPIAEVEPALRKLSELEVSIGPMNRSDAARLATRFRDVTPELHRPAREALREAFSDPGMAARVLEQFRAYLTVCPAELEPRPLLARLARDPASWWLQVVQFADQARVLGPLLAIALEVAPGLPRLARVHATFEAWDLRLGFGYRSAWAQTKVGQQE